ncbi:GD21306 [Drosophila simulans]|uniref:GD21306 n=1 Tax=Drosophila simulans TaxID=7240 RepID=B4QWS1_DROSI|nr:GD21306 [Drosophila simulans]
MNLQLKIITSVAPAHDDDDDDDGVWYAYLPRNRRVIKTDNQTDRQPGKRQTAEQVKGPRIKGKDIGQDMLEGAGAGDADGDGEKATT